MAITSLTVQAVQYVQTDQAVKSLGDRKMVPITMFLPKCSDQDLEAALEQFREIAGDLGAKETEP